MEDTSRPVHLNSVNDLRPEIDTTGCAAKE